MKTVLLTLFLLTSIVVGKAQDTLYMKDGKVMSVRVYEVNKSKVKFKLYSNLKAPLITVKSNTVERIVYENKQEQVFSDEEFKKLSAFDRRNRINVDLIGIGVVFYPSVLSYERINAKGTVGIEIPLTVFIEEQGFFAYSIGVSMKNYIGGSGRGFYYGPTFSVGGANRFMDFAYIGAKTGWQIYVSRLIGFNLGANVGAVTNFHEFAFGASVYVGISFSF